jgi:hypothetical protein
MNCLEISTEITSKYHESVVKFSACLFFSVFFIHFTKMINKKKVDRLPISTLALYVTNELVNENGELKAKTQ